MINDNIFSFFCVAGQPTSVAVWWIRGTQITHYSLIKTAKGMNNQHICPRSSQITH